MSSKQKASRFVVQDGILDIFAKGHHVSIDPWMINAIATPPHPQFPGAFVTEHSLLIGQGMVISVADIDAATMTRALRWARRMVREQYKPGEAKQMQEERPTDDDKPDGSGLAIA